jgi:RNA polymerase sigma-70 factor (ECF subfamily)
LNLQELYTSYSKQVFNLALQYVQNREDAEEITQDVFVKVHQNLETFKHESKHSTWIYRITINTSLDYLKAKKRKKRFGIFTSLFHSESSEIKYESISFEHPGVALEQREALENLFRCINELPENQKTALILHKIEQQSQAEIAEVMQLTPKAVESLIQRAKASLEKKLKSSEGK